MPTRPAAVLSVAFSSPDAPVSKKKAPSPVPSQRLPPLSTKTDRTSFLAGEAVLVLYRSTTGLFPLFRPGAAGGLSRVAGPAACSSLRAESGDTLPSASTAAPSEVAMNILPEGPSAAHRVSVLESPCDSPNSTRLLAAYLNSPALVDIHTALWLSTMTLRTS